ncbi:MAG: hypothetical protein JRF27_01125 [Deltaproteobacteria bacterium]|nr:hypothetical protein [Deltaproteobacteria bacterium]MBW2192367.1 hypothetical protein [Deltaproteobacteria bacterium]
MNNTFKLSSSAVLFFIFILTACTPTKLIDAKKDDAYTGGPLKSVMVLGIADNIRNREMFEKAFAKQFNIEGVEATTSLDAIPRDVKLDKDNVDSHKDIIKAAAVKQGMDAILITHLVGVEEKEVYHPPMYDPFVVSGVRDFGSLYYTNYHATYTPEHYTKHEYVRLESNLYDVETEQLIWTAASETVDPKSVDETIDTLCKAVIKNLRKNNLIQ